MMDKAKLCYIFLVILRFALTVVPQTGYLHPDEYFQCPEIVYGDVFGLMTLRTWEFETEKPIRSISFPYIIVGIPALLMNTFVGDSLLKMKFTPYLLLISPRLIMCFISLLHDFCFFKLCKILGRNPFHILIIFASSYVTLVHFTRTFSNTLEAACLTQLCYLVATEVVKKKCSDKTEINIEGSSQKNGANYYECGIIIAVGCFIRPTFLIFSVIPIIFLVLLCLRGKSIQNMLQCVVGAICVALPLSLIDTVYYNDDFSLEDSFNITTLLENLIFTPINFIKYNLDIKKLSQHGYHPWYVHFLVNVPVTFSLLGLYGLVNCLSILLQFFTRKARSISKLELFMLLSFTLPVCFLSFIPHQESRFLIPLMFPLICLCGEQLFVYCLKYKFIAAVWGITNILGLIFFGFFHQGGMFSALSYFHTTALKFPSAKLELVFYHTYMPPQHLIAIRHLPKKISIHDLAGASDEVLLSTIQEILQYAGHSSKVYIISPSSVTIPIVNVNIVLSPNYNVKVERKFFPHLSTEDFPVFYNIWNVLTRQSSSFSYKLHKLKDFFCLNVYRIEPTLKS